MTFAPRTWVVGEVVSAATMNQEIRDQFNSFFGAWTVYTPTWTGTSTNPSIGNGTITGRYMKIGRTVICEMNLVTGSTTTYGAGQYGFSLPAQAAASGVDAEGTARLTAGATYIGQAFIISGGTSMSAAFPTAATPANAGNMTPTAPATLAAGHTMRLSIVYEAAS
ncbi:hypothetical protein ACF1AY_04950 [Streptomyces sp. NPDC014776]|uniref:hypothetical protein n=1 Tax=Streptomyces sp. NPDC014776 TaxID=3364909 RepID=UPI0036F8B1BA